MSKFRLGDIVTYEERTCRIEQGKIILIDDDHIKVKVLKVRHNCSWDVGTIVTTHYLEECHHVWKCKYMLSPLWKKLEGIK